MQLFFTSFFVRNNLLSILISEESQFTFNVLEFQPPFAPLLTTSWLWGGRNSKHLEQCDSLTSDLKRVFAFSRYGREQPLLDICSAGGFNIFKKTSLLWNTSTSRILCLDTDMSFTGKWFDGSDKLLPFGSSWLDWLFRMVLLCLWP